MTLIILYGIDGNKKDVTTKCLEQLHNNIITIPPGDNSRAAIFGDHIFGVEKKIYVIIDETEYIYDTSHLIIIDIINSTVNTYRNLYTAVMIEFRQHQALQFVLSNFLDNLSLEWNFVIFCGNLNFDFIHNIIKDLPIHKSRITVHKLNYDNLFPHEYSDLMITNKYIYDNIPTDIFLIFQTDSIILEKNKHEINQFLNYDYVGAPWGYNSTRDVGNGGLSLRKKHKMIEIMDREDSSRKKLPEDLFFSGAEKVSLHKPEPRHACLFSVENCHGNNNPFGCHKPWGIVGIDSEFCRMYPEIIKLYELNK